MGLDIGITRIRKSLNTTSNWEVAYWRKANQIYKFFIDLDEKAANCHPIKITLGDLKKLRNLCQTILDDNSKAKELLPPHQGFFFGTYEIDEWYLEDLNNTIKYIDVIELMHYPEDEYIFWSSW